MSCGCNKEVYKRPEREPKKVHVEQLYRRIEQTPCSVESRKPVYPQTVMQAVFDGYTGKRLDYVLAMANHIYLPWRGCLKDTLRQIPRGVRRRGLVITTVDGAGQVITRQYTGSCSDGCKEITNPKYWSPIGANKDTFYKPYNIRMQGQNLITEFIDDRGKLHALQTKIDGLFRYEVKTRAFLGVPEMAEEGVIYLVPNDDAPGTFREFMKVSYMRNGQLVHKLEQFGSASGICNRQGGPDRSLKSVVYENGELVFRVGLSPEVDADGSLDEVLRVPFAVENGNLEALERRVKVLENKEDKDTIFNPSSLLKTIEDLTNELKAVKAKQAELERKQDVYAVSGEWVDDDTIKISNNNGTSFLISKNVVQEWRELPAKTTFDAPLPVEWDTATDPTLYADESTVVRTAVLGKRVLIEEELYRNGKPTGTKRTKSDVHTPGVAEMRRRGAKKRPVVTTQVVVEKEAVQPGPNGPDQYDNNAFEDVIVTIQPVVGERQRNVTYTLIDGVRQANPQYGEWTVTKPAKPGYRVVGRKKRPVAESYTTYLGKYPHRSGIGEEGHPITAADIKALTATVASSPAEVFKQITVVSHENSKFSYAYPKSLGAVTKIIDGSNDDIRENFDETTVSIDGVDYLVYTIAAPFGSTRKLQEIPFTFVK